MNPTTIAATFGDRVRVRVCGVAIDTSGSILLANHRRLNDQNEWWAPPGGGVEVGETLDQALTREFKEETNLVIEVKELLFVTEHMENSLHAVEIFFHVNILSGGILVGFDPELPHNEQSIHDVKFVTFDELAIIPNERKHQCLLGISNARELLSKKGYLIS